jgi:cystathionine beta-lyase/cystathionine gamma-synthase
VLAKKQFGGLFGGVVTFDLAAGSRESAFRFLDSLELAASAATLGDLWTEFLYPSISSHRRVAPEERARLGITDGTLRMSVGIEDPDDLIADLENALARV